MFGKLKSLVGMGATGTKVAIDEAAGNMEVAFAKNMPNIYSKAAIAKVKEEVDKSRAKFVDAEAKMEKETQDVVKMQEEIDKASAMMTALKKKRNKAVKAEDEATITRLNEKGARLAKKIKELTDKLNDKEIPEMEAAKAKFERVENIYKGYQAKLDQMEAQADTLKAKLEEQKEKQELIQMEAQEKEALAALEDSLNATNAAFNSINLAVEEEEKKTREMELKLEETKSAAGDDLDDIMDEIEDELEAPKKKGSDDPFAGF